MLLFFFYTFLHSIVEGVKIRLITNQEFEFYVAYNN